MEVSLKRAFCWGSAGDSATYGGLQKAWQANAKPGRRRVWGMRQEMWVLVLGPKSLSDLGPVFDLIFWP